MNAIKASGIERLGSGNKRGIGDLSKNFLIGTILPPPPTPCSQLLITPLASTSWIFIQTMEVGVQG
jgi:hypothetical protein